MPHDTISLPQPSPAGPQLKPCWAQFSDVQVGGGVLLVGRRQEPRSKIMNSSIFSWAVIVPPGHSLGKIEPVSAATFSTWKSSKSTRPHCDEAWVPTGVSKV